MNSEVKLILKKLEIVSEEQQEGMYLCDKEHSKLLLDYITNLQQELEEEKRINQEDLKLIDELQQENEKLKNIISSVKEDFLNANNELTNLQHENERLKLEKDTKSVSEIICENLHDVYKSRCEKANKELINSKEYQMAVAMELNAKQSILIKLDNIINGRSDE